MAFALICDVCGETFASNKAESQTGRWFTKHVTRGGQLYRMVYGAFKIRTDAEREAERGGLAQDICASCAAGMVGDNGDKLAPEEQVQTSG